MTTPAASPQPSAEGALSSHSIFFSLGTNGRNFVYTLILSSPHLAFWYASLPANAGATDQVLIDP
ncbi:hypothetical protein [Pseudomonas sp. Irchel s3f7]|uniref:hypothetical protein n=1 Tax=Pseudomonas sp. Irchel s3f7 TaxID=2009153 RepID=UPI00117A01C5|nr:hypothetical protein [Pseudomonas sp. Irchel s3f7]